MIFDKQNDRKKCLKYEFGHETNEHVAIIGKYMINFLFSS